MKWWQLLIICVVVLLLVGFFPAYFWRVDTDSNKALYMGSMQLLGGIVGGVLSLAGVVITILYTKHATDESNRRAAKPFLEVVPYGNPTGGPHKQIAFTCDTNPLQTQINHENYMHYLERRIMPFFVHNSGKSAAHLLNITCSSQNIEHKLFTQDKTFIGVNQTIQIHASQGIYYMKNSPLEVVLTYEDLAGTKYRLPVLFDEREIRQNMDLTSPVSEITVTFIEETYL